MPISTNFHPRPHPAGEVLDLPRMPIVWEFGRYGKDRQYRFYATYEPSDPITAELFDRKNHDLASRRCSVTLSTNIVASGWPITTGTPSSEVLAKGDSTISFASSCSIVRSELLMRCYGSRFSFEDTSRDSA